MTVTRLALVFAAPIVFSITALSAPAHAAKTSPAFERAMMAEMDAPTRAMVQKRLGGGNTVRIRTDSHGPFDK